MLLLSLSSLVLIGNAVVVVAFGFSLRFRPCHRRPSPPHVSLSIQYVLVSLHVRQLCASDTQHCMVLLLFHHACLHCVHQTSAALRQTSAAMRQASAALRQAYFNVTCSDLGPARLSRSSPRQPYRPRSRCLAPCRPRTARLLLRQAPRLQERQAPRLLQRQGQWTAWTPLAVGHMCPVEGQWTPRAVGRSPRLLERQDGMRWPLRAQSPRPAA